MQCFTRCEQCPGLSDVEEGPILCDAPWQCSKVLAFDVDWKTLHSASAPVEAGDVSIYPLLDKLTAVNKKLKGAGMAAVQIGELRQVAIVTVNSALVLINPVLLTHGRDIEIALEGCLSTPGYMLPVPRWRVVTFQALDREFKSYTKTVKGLEARAVQHEVDHMQGRLVVDALGDPTVNG